MLALWSTLQVCYLSLILSLSNQQSRPTRRSLQIHQILFLQIQRMKRGLYSVVWLKRGLLFHCFGSMLPNQQRSSSCSKCRLHVSPVSENQKKREFRQGIVSRQMPIQFHQKQKRRCRTIPTSQSQKPCVDFFPSLLQSSWQLLDLPELNPYHQPTRELHVCLTACSTHLETGNEFRWSVEEAVHTPCRTKYRVYLALGFSCHLTGQLSIVLVWDGWLERLHIRFYLHQNEYNKEEQWKN